MKVKRNKKIIIISVVVSIILIFIIGTAMMFFKKQENKGDDWKKTTKKIKKEKNYLEKYQDYLEDSDLLEDDTEGVLIDFEKDKNPELVLKYLNDNEESTLKILSIHGDDVRESSEYSLYFLSILYDNEKEDYAYYIETKEYDGVKYLPIIDIISEKSNIEEIEDKDEEHENGIDDEEFNYKYIKVTTNVDMYTISKEDLENDLKRLDKKYQEEKDYVTTSEDEKVKKQSQDIKNNTLKKDNTGIFNNNYKVQYGTYEYGQFTLTLNSNDSANYKRDSVGAGFDMNGSFTLFYDQIVFAGTSSKLAFKVVGNNQLQSIEKNSMLDNAIWNLR